MSGSGTSDGRERSAATYEVSSGQPVSEAVVAAVTELACRESSGPGSPVEATRAFEPLYDVVDPDALDRLFGPTERTPADRCGRVTFSYGGHEVTVSSSGLIQLAPLARD